MARHFLSCVQRSEMFHLLGFDDLRKLPKFWLGRRFHTIAFLHSACTQFWSCMNVRGPAGKKKERNKFHENVFFFLLFPFLYCLGLFPSVSSWFFPVLLWPYVEYPASKKPCERTPVSTCLRASLFFVQRGKKTGLFVIWAHRWEIKRLCNNVTCQAME